MGFEVRTDELRDDASAFDRLAAQIDDMVAHLCAPVLSGDALAGPELGPVEAAFEELWQRSCRDLTSIAGSVRHLSAAVRGASAMYEEADSDVASKARRLIRGV